MPPYAQRRRLSFVVPAYNEEVYLPADLDSILAQTRTLPSPVLYYDLTPCQRLLVHVFYLAAWITYALNRCILRVGSMVQGGNFITSRTALESVGGFNTTISFYGEDTDIARRLKSEGILTMAVRYSINYLWTTFLKRPFTNTHTDIRDS